MARPQRQAIHAFPSGKLILLLGHSLLVSVLIRRVLDLLNKIIHA
jgi:hypothetical protein